MAVSLRDLRKHTHALTTLVDEAFASTDKVATIDYEIVRQHARGILTLVGEPKAATDNEAKKDAAKRAAYQRAAADKKPFDTSTLYRRS